MSKDELTLDEWAADVAATNDVTVEEEPDAPLLNALAAVVLKHGLPDKTGIPYFAYAVYLRDSIRALEQAKRFTDAAKGGE